MIMGQPIGKITLRGFKSIRDLEDFPLRNLNILIGVNGAGKSHFLDFFRLLRAMAEESLQTFIIQRGGADGFFFMGPKCTPRVSARLEFGQLVYEFALGPTSPAHLMIEGESIHDAGGAAEGGSTYSMSKGSLESVLKESRDPESVKGRWFDLFGVNIYEPASSRVVYHFHDTSRQAPMRRVGSVRDNEYLRPDGENLGAFLLMLQEGHPQVYAKIRDTIRLAAPFFDDFQFRPKTSHGDEVLHLEWTQKDSDYPFLVTQFSDGTLRFIALATALLQPDPPATILLDEPELGLHPYVLDRLAGLVKTAATRTQVIVSTQSAPLLDNFVPEDIIVVKRREGASTFERLSSADLGEWLKDYSLGELWQKNMIGGRPADGWG